RKRPGYVALTTRTGGSVFHRCASEDKSRGSCMTASLSHSATWSKPVSAMATSWLTGFHVGTLFPLVFSPPIGNVSDFKIYSVFANREVCDNVKFREVLEPSNPRARSVLIDCNLNLTRNVRAVTKRLVF